MNEQDEKNFEEWFKKGMYYLKFSLVDPKCDIGEVVKGWMRESYFEARRTLMEKQPQNRCFLDDEEENIYTEQDGTPIKKEKGGTNG